MHYMALVFTEVPKIQENKKKDQEIKQKLEESTLQKQLGTETIMLDDAIEKYHSLQSAFSCAVNSSISSIMYPYWMSIEDPDYMEFYDETEWLCEKYNGVVDCIKLPQGTIIEQGSYLLQDRFSVHSGKVFQRKAGPLSHEKRTKKVKKMKVFPDYPYKKLYKSFKEFAERYGASFDKAHQGYGYYYNLNGMYNCCVIGGRWSQMFLVKDTCIEYSVGRRRQGYPDTQPNPEGYIWVCAARKKDIAWDVMRDWRDQKTVEDFYRFERMFQTGKADTDFLGKITPDGVAYLGELVFRKGTSLEKYLEEYGIPKSWKYPIDSYDIVNTDQWLGRDDCVSGFSSWHDCIDQYIDDADEDTVLVAVDYHR